MQPIKFRNVVSIIVGALALTATLSSTASARPIPSFEALTPTGPVILEKGDPLYFNSANVVLNTSGGTITCTNGQLNGVLNGNGLKTDGFSVTGGVFDDGTDEYCGNGITKIPGPAKVIVPEGMNWAGTLRTNGKSQLVGPELTISFSQAGVECTWAARKVNSTFNANGQAITVMTTNAKFKAVAGNNPTCPAMGTVSASWSLRTKIPGRPEGLPPVILP